MHLPPQVSSQPDDVLDVAFCLLTPPHSPVRTTSQKLIDEIVSSSASKLPLTRMEVLSGRHLHNLVALNLSNGTRLVLKISPASTVLLLRHERHLLQSEAAVYTALAKSSLPIPKVLKYEHESTHLGAPFLLISRLDGVTYADVLPHLSRAEKSSIERQLNAVRTVINQYTSPTFGLAGISSRRGTYKHWREAFVSMMDAILMDGEDMMVNIPYFQIRAALSRWETYLNEVTEARLVILDLGKPDNILIDRKFNKITGLLDFGSAVWGDPDLASAEGKSDIKSLLYVCYRATVTIVRNTYRADDDAGELESRKILTNALAQLFAA